MDQSNVATVDQANFTLIYKGRSLFPFTRNSLNIFYILFLPRTNLTVWRVNYVVNFEKIIPNSLLIFLIHLGESYLMHRSNEETIEEFAKFLEAQLGVSLATQKLVRKGKNLLSENKDQKLSQLVSNLLNTMKYDKASISE